MASEIVGFPLRGLVDPIPLRKARLVFSSLCRQGRELCPVHLEAPRSSALQETDLDAGTGIQDWDFESNGTRVLGKSKISEAKIPVEDEYVKRCKGAEIAVLHLPVPTFFVWTFFPSGFTGLALLTWNM